MKLTNLLSYESFISEKYTIDDKIDPPEIISHKASFNQTEEFIREFNSRKSVLDSIYMSYIDRTDLINKLKSNKFIIDDKEIKFTNPLLGMWARMAQKNRNIRTLQESIRIYSEDISNKNKTINEDPSMAEELKSEIESLNTKINDNRSKITTLNQEISDLKKEIELGLKEFKEKLNNDISSIDKYEQNKNFKK